MADVKWMIKGPHYGNCNCDWGCPCQFNKAPTHGDCQAVGAMRIDEGYYDDIKLDGLKWASTFKWPGAVHEGNGSYQAFIDERADEAQRKAIGDIIMGKVGEAGSTVLTIFASTMTTVHDPIYTAIEFEHDMENCKARFKVPGIIESTGGPMKSPFDGSDHRIRMSIPGGMEFKEVECGSATTKATGVIKLDFTDSWAQISNYHFDQDGIVG